MSDDADEAGDEVGEAQSLEAGDEVEPDYEMRLAAVLEALVFNLKLIVITLGEEDDAQVIFETLNSAGQPLLAMDLVRNNIFQRAEIQFQGSEEGKQRAEEIYREAWQPFDHGWWRAPAPNARPSRPRIDHFLAHVLTAETGERTTVRELYAEYRAWATPKRMPRFESVEDELAVLQKYVATYEALEGRNPSLDGRTDPVAWMGERLRLWQNTTVYPVIFQLCEQIENRQELSDTFVMIDNYFMRRMLAGLTAKNLNQVFARLSSSIKENGASRATMIEYFSRLSGDSVRFPSDGEIAASFKAMPAYHAIPSRILTDIFWSIELKLRTKMTEATAKPSSLWVEHILPQSWKENWRLNDVAPDDVGPETPGFWARQEALQTIGNLTIVTDRLNISMGKLPFDEKKRKLVEHSNLTLNRHICELNRWDEESIADRSRQLAELANEIWPSPLPT